MTRANITVLTIYGKYKFQANSSAYPSNVIEPIINFATSVVSNNAVFNGKIGMYDEPCSSDLSTFIEEVGLTFGHVGNPSYYYDIDFVKGEIRVYDTNVRWINAPIDWEEKGWRGLYEGKNGKLGYHSIIKGKNLLTYSILDLAFINDEKVVINKDIVERLKKVN